jgi:formylglycine-generating enzyme required for sulfatase activity
MDLATRLDFDWIEIPAGSFWMGTDLTQDPVAASPDWLDWAMLTECPQHSVTLDGFRITRYPITNAQWKAFLDDSGYVWPDRDRLWSGGLPAGKEWHPVTWVTWHDALAFCRWAGVRLPSDAEWEKAARGDDRRLYPWGNQAPTPALANYADQVGDTTSVDRYPDGRSPYGVYDMAGNTWEWISTLWGRDKDDPEFRHPYRPDDGRESLDDSTRLRMVRGGGWKYPADLIRAAYRDWNMAGVRGSALGFRVVAD